MADVAGCGHPPVAAEFVLNISFVLLHGYWGFQDDTCSLPG